MRRIDFKYTIWWKLRWNFKELYHKSVTIAEILDSSLMTEDEIHWEKEFTKEDMLLLIDLIKKKILEAKERNLPLVFSGD